MINLGSINKDTVDKVRCILLALGRSGRISIAPLVPKLCDIDLGVGLRLQFEAPYIFDYQFEGEDCRITFFKKLKIRWKFMSVTVNEVVIDHEAILINAGFLNARLQIQR